MRTSSKKTPVAVLRTILGIKDTEMAELLGRSVATIHSIECGRQRLTEENALTLFHETRICPKWLLAGDPNRPVMANGEPYERDLYERAQAEKMSYDRPHEFFKRYDQLHFAATLIAIVESAHRRKNYFIASYKIREMLNRLRAEFGQDAASYPVDNTRTVDHVTVIDTKRAASLLNSISRTEGVVDVAAFGKNEIRQGERRLKTVRRRRSKLSSVHRRRSARA